VGGPAVLQQLADAFQAGEGGAGPDDDRDADAGQVLGAFESVGVLLGGRPAGQPEPEKHHRAGRDVGQVVDRVTQQPDRTGEQGQQQFGQAGQGQADRAEAHGPVGLPPLVRVVARPGQRERQSRVALLHGLVHAATIARGRAGPSSARPGGRGQARAS
jgi:hypothetical protein